MNALRASRELLYFAGLSTTLTTRHAVPVGIGLISAGGVPVSRLGVAPEQPTRAARTKAGTALRISGAGRSRGNLRQFTIVTVATIGADPPSPAPPLLPVTPASPPPDAGAGLREQATAENHPRRTTNHCISVRSAKNPPRAQHESMHTESRFRVTHHLRAYAQDAGERAHQGGNPGKSRVIVSHVNLLVDNRWRIHSSARSRYRWRPRSVPVSTSSSDSNHLRSDHRHRPEPQLPIGPGSLASIAALRSFFLRPSASASSP